MKILRHVNPSLNQSIAIVGINFFSILLEKLIKLSGANVFLIDFDNEAKKLNGAAINTLIYYSLTPKVNEFISKINCKHKIDLNSISLYDKGLNDNNYIKGVKYPFSYVRWDYKKNLEYFVNLLKKDVINLDFLDIEYIEVNNLDDIYQKINAKEKNLKLFKIIL